MTEQPYGREYWETYRALDKSPSGQALTAARRALVGKYWVGEVVDIGIGGGKFVAERPATRGFDVNPSAVDWLKTRGAWCDVYEEKFDAACFWDCLEHIHDPAPILANVRLFVFVSVPIFDGPEHVLRSKHFKRAEHCWYHTHDGLRHFMRLFGFEMIYSDRREEACGREGIESAVFKRMKP